MSEMEPIRLSKRLSDLGLASRREADTWIANGWVKVDDHIAQLGEKVLPDQKILISSNLPVPT
jgi:23S rRNA pseudouridine2604 synthase